MHRRSNTRSAPKKAAVRAPTRKMTTARRAPRCATPVVAARRNISVSAQRKAQSAQQVLNIPQRGFAAKKEGYVTLSLNSPNVAVYNAQPVHMIELVSSEGDMGIVANHSPYLAQLGPGVVRVIEEPSAEPKKFFVPGGFATIDQNSAAVITASEIIPIEDLDADLARKAIEKNTIELAQAADDKAKALCTINIEVANAALRAVV